MSEKKSLLNFFQNNRKNNVEVYDEENGYDLVMNIEEEVDVLIRESNIFRTLFEQTPICIELYNQKGELLYANNACLRMFGVSNIKEAMGFNLFKGTTLNEEKREKLRKGIPISYCSKYDFDYIKHLNYYYKTNKSGIAFFNYNITPLLGTNRKEISGYLIQVQDISDWFIKEKQLGESEEKYKTFISLLSEGVCRVESSKPIDINLPIEEQIDLIYDNMYIAECNDSFLKMYGLSNKNDIIGKNIQVSHGGKFIDLNRESFRMFITNNYRIENITTEEVDAKGGKKYFSNNSLGIIKGKYLIRIWSSQIDITERVTAEKKQQVLYNILSYSSKPISLDNLILFIRSELSVLIDTTNFFIAFYDYNTDSISSPVIIDAIDNFSSFPAGKTVTKYVISEQKTFFAKKKKIIELIDEGKIELVGTMPEVWLGIPIILETKVLGVLVLQSYTNEEAFNDSDLKLLEAITNQISDFLKRKLIEKDLILSLEKATESDRLKSVFLTNMSHEFRTPLNAIIGFSSLIQESANIDLVKLKEYNKNVLSSAKALLNIIDDLFVFSMAECGTLKISKEKIHIKEFFDELKCDVKRIQSEMLKNELNIRLLAPEENLIIKTDSVRLKHILLH
jgi:PAS domain S-box-containing protein